MKLLIASDLHGSHRAAARLATLVATHKPQALVLLGDLLYHGPRNALPEEYDAAKTAACLNALAVPLIAVAGNCDAEVDQILLSFPLAPDFAWILGEECRIMATHGHRRSPEDCGRTNALSSGDVFLSGHTHVPEARQQDGLHIWNPGSLAMPKGGFPPSYGLFSQGRFTVLGPDDAPLMEDAV